MKKSLVLAMAMALGVTASAYAPQILSVMYRQATGLMTQLTNWQQKVLWTVTPTALTVATNL